MRFPALSLRLRRAVAAHFGAPVFMVLAVLLVAPVFLTTPVYAVQPDEILADPGLETRARMISREIRCPVCQGESIDDSNAQISRDLRLIIRERLLAGDSNDEVIDFVVMRYGEFVLFNPRVTGWNWVLWLSGPVALIVAGAGTAIMLRRRAAAVDEAVDQAAGEAAMPRVAGLSPEEDARLREILKE